MVYSVLLRALTNASEFSQAQVCPGAIVPTTGVTNESLVQSFPKANLPTKYLSPSASRSWVEGFLMGETSPDHEEEAFNDARAQRGFSELLCPA